MTRLQQQQVGFLTGTQGYSMFPVNMAPILEYIYEIESKEMKIKTGCIVRKSTVREINTINLSDTIHKWELN